jgi:hypothetical protein
LKIRNDTDVELASTRKEHGIEKDRLISDQGIELNKAKTD